MKLDKCTGCFVSRYVHAQYDLYMRSIKTWKVDTVMHTV